MANPSESAEFLLSEAPRRGLDQDFVAVRHQKPTHRLKLQQILSIRCLKKDTPIGGVLDLVRRLAKPDPHLWFVCRGR